MKALLIFILLFAASAKPLRAGGDKETLSVAGRVVDHGTAEGLAGVAVQLSRGEDVTVVYSDFEGRFDVQNLVPGTYTLKIYLVSYEELQISGFEISDKSADLVLKLQAR